MISRSLEIDTIRHHITGNERMLEDFFIEAFERDTGISQQPMMHYET